MDKRKILFLLGLFLLLHHLIVYKRMDLNDFPIFGHEWLGLWLIIISFIFK